MLANQGENQISDRSFWGDWEIRRLGDGEIRRWGDSEMGRLGNGEIGKWGDWEFEKGNDSCKNNLNSFFNGSYISQFIPDQICTTYFYMAPNA